MLRFLLARLSSGFGLYVPAGINEPDPIDHPAFHGLSLRELADLPFPRPDPREEVADALGPEETPPSEPHDLRPAA